MTAQGWLILAFAMVLGFEFRGIARRILPEPEWLRAALVLGWPWAAYSLFFLFSADLGDREEWVWALVGISYLVFAMIPYWIGFALEGIWRRATSPIS